MYYCDAAGGLMSARLRELRVGNPTVQKRLATRLSVGGGGGGGCSPAAGELHQKMLVSASFFFSRDSGFGSSLHLFPVWRPQIFEVPVHKVWLKMNY